MIIERMFKIVGPTSQTSKTYWKMKTSLDEYVFLFIFSMYHIVTLITNLGCTPHLNEKRAPNEPQAQLTHLFPTFYSSIRTVKTHAHHKTHSIKLTKPSFRPKEMDKNKWSDKCTSQKNMKKQIIETHSFLMHVQKQ